MKKSLLLLSLSYALFASPQGDVALTAGFNSYDNNDLFKDNRTFLGIRGGVILDNSLGFQLGYERATNVTSDNYDVSANRIYVNLVKEFDIFTPITPYLLAGLGYEMLDDEWYEDDQLSVSAGIGARYAFINQFGVFAETSFIHKLNSDDTDFITRVGLSYRFNNRLTTSTKEARYTPIQDLKKVKVSQRKVSIQSGYAQNPAPYMETMNIESVQRDTYVEPILLDEVIDDSVLTTSEDSIIIYDLDDIASDTKGNHYIQLMALAKTSPDSYIQRLSAKGIHNLGVKEVIRGNKSLSIIVAGPYTNRDEAKRHLSKLRRYSPSAFIKRFD